ncbi:MAG TPA: alkaline phosphatase D family protein [Solirubrobacteraceae bacterium]
MQTRRQFVSKAAAVGAATIVAPEVLAQLAWAKGAGRPLRSAGSFADGLASGDPTPNSIVLWSRLDGVKSAGTAQLEVALDKGFRKVVTRTNVPTGPDVNGSLKAQVSKLKPYEEYFYRFSTKTKDSPVGRFRTALPAGSRQPVNFAFWSCQDYTHGWYNALAHLNAQDLDFVVCLGDYIYDETYHTVKDGTAVRDDTIGSPLPGYNDGRPVALTLADYRRKYSLYRKDENLRRMHQQFAFVSLWDDHEVQDNYAGKEADGGLPAVQKYSTARKQAGYKAWQESMPTFGAGKGKGTRIYRRLQFGSTVDLIIMDQRQYRQNQPCDDAVAPACADWDQPRDFLGRTQMNWVKDQLSQSKAAWKVLANEVTIMPTKVLGDSFYTFDAWQGYPREREELLQHIDEKGIKDVVFVTGDIHTFIAGGVERGFDGKGKTVATEFVGGSTTSQGLGETDLDAGGGVTLKGNDANPATPPSIIDALKGIDTWVETADFDKHGYGLVKADQSGFDCSLVRMSTIKKKTTKTEPQKGFRWKLPRGQVGTVGHEV